MEGSEDAPVRSFDLCKRICACAISPFLVGELYNMYEPGGQFPRMGNGSRAIIMILLM